MLLSQWPALGSAWGVRDSSEATALSGAGSTALSELWPGEPGQVGPPDPCPHVAPGKQKLVGESSRQGLLRWGPPSLPGPHSFGDSHSGH